MHVIPVTWEAETEARGSQVWDQHQQLSETVSQNKKNGDVAQWYNTMDSIQVNNNKNQYPLSATVVLEYKTTNDFQKPKYDFVLFNRHFKASASQVWD